MKRLSRNAVLFEGLSLADVVGREHGLTLNSPELRGRVEKQLGEVIEINLAKPHLVHGQRVQAMFGFVAASLGSCQLVKQEDAGEVFAAPDIAVPDYRLVLCSGQQILVEVKNHFPKNPRAPLVLRASYLARLAAYAKLMNCPGFLAIYWARWQLWSLVSLDAISALSTEEKVALELTTAMRINEMALIGDVMIGTVSPLCVRFVANTSKVRRVGNDGKVIFTIGDVQVFAGGQRLRKKHEKNIAFYLHLFGGWRERNRVEVLDQNVEWVEYCAEPDEQVSGQGFDIVAPLSSMIARRFNGITTIDGSIVRLLPAVGPASLGVLIDPDYVGEDLPLWRFTVSPTRQGASSL